MTAGASALPNRPPGVHARSAPIHWPSTGKRHRLHRLPPDRCVATQQRWLGVSQTKSQ